jgi:Stress responsive A/B Barrel Domain
MTKKTLLTLALALAPLAASAQDPPKALAHDVYFSLNDASPNARAELVAACRKYLTGHEGVLVFSAGVVAGELDRPVNDRDFDVALHMTFDGKASHDKYQEAPRHKQFIAEQQKNWKKVRVFDSWVELGK